MKLRNIFIKNLATLQLVYSTGQERLIRTRLIRSSTWFEVTVKYFSIISQHFMFKMHGQFEFPLNSRQNLADE